MSQVLFIDGENFKGYAEGVFKLAGKSKPNWAIYDFRNLFEKILKGNTVSKKVFYFAKLSVHSETFEKSKKLIEEQRLLKTNLEKQNFEVIQAGRVRGYSEINNQGKKVLIFKEKGVDVKIAVDLVIGACDKQLKQAFICSSDSDLQPAIREAVRRGVNVTYIGFQANPNKGLTYTTNQTILIRDAEILEFERQE